MTKVCRVRVGGVSVNGGSRNRGDRFKNSSMNRAIHRWERLLLSFGIGLSEKSTLSADNFDPQGPR